MVKLKNDKEIGDKINKLIGRLADANESLKGAINVADFNDEEKLGKGKEMVDRLMRRWRPATLSSRSPTSSSWWSTTNGWRHWAGTFRASSIASARRSPAA